MSTSVFTATGAVHELRYLRLGAGKPVVLLHPLLGLLVARAGTKAILRRVLEGGLHDPKMLPAELVEEHAAAGSLPGYSRAFRSLAVNWRSWIEARAVYPQTSLPVTLAYGDEDWPHQAEREANLQATGAKELMLLPASGHFSSLDRPGEVAKLIEGVML